jgi:Ca2+/H+ antiporter
LAFFPIKGFLGTGARFEADLNPLVQVVMGVALIAGAVLAKRKRYTAHGICQTTVLFLSLGMIALVMWPWRQHQLRPALAESLHEMVLRGGYDSFLLGGAAELLGLYIVIVAGTSVLPQSLRF